MTCVTKDVAVARPGRAIGVSDFIVVLISVHDHDVMINAPIKKKNKFLLTQAATSTLIAIATFCHPHRRLTENNLVSVNLGIKSFKNRIVFKLIQQQIHQVADLARVKDIKHQIAFPALFLIDAF